MSNEVQSNMEYIQKLFLEVQKYMETKPDLESLIAYLDDQAPGFRSVGYESASMELGLAGISKGSELKEWKKFHSLSKNEHAFQVDIGLGWAFAKTQTYPSIILDSFSPPRRWMVFDGIGYYHGLFKGRRTVRKHIVPEEVDRLDLGGFDQGVGRRLWYIAKGEVNELTSLVEAFPSSRHLGLWRGVGVACGYVGACKNKNLELLLSASGEYNQQLSVGIALAAMSRITSDTVTNDIRTACKMICKMTMEEIKDLNTKILDQSDGYKDKGYSHWLTQIESVFG